MRRTGQILHRRRFAGVRRDPRRGALRSVAAMILTLGSGWIGSGCGLPPTRQMTLDPVSLPSDEVRLPVRWLGDFPLVETYVNGEGPFRFVIDTGAAVSAIGPDVLSSAFDAVSEGFDVKDSHGRTRKSLGLRVLDLTVGTMEFSDVEAAVLDMDPLSTVLGEPVAGILGFPVFSDVLLTLDYPRHQVRLAMGELPRPDGDEVLLLELDPLPHVEVELAGETGRFLVDSGSVETIAVEHWPKSALFLAGPVPLAVGVSVLGSVRIDQVARLGGEFKLGRHEFPEPIVQSCVDGRRLGAGLLRYFAVTFDVANERVRFARDLVDPIAMDPVLGTGMLFEVRPGGWLVLAIVPNSPAERAGVQIGDRLVEVDGIRVDQLVGVTDWNWANEFIFSIDRGGIVNRFRVGVAPLVP